MVNTKDYKTKTIFQERRTPSGKNWMIGLDVGYSGVKVFSPNAVACFPAYAVRETAPVTKIAIAGYDEPEGTDIRYQDEAGNIWSVGETAQDSISVEDTSAGSNALFVRNRYDSPSFKVCMRVGLAAGMRANSCGNPSGRKIKVMTGLPPKYMASDKDALISAISGHHRFSVMFGSKWEHFDFTIDKADVNVMDQPEGTLISIATDANMHMMPDARNYFTGKVLIMDTGFGTLDLFPVMRQKISRDMCNTFPDLGMRAVLEDTAREIFSRYNFEVSVPAMQQYLERGFVFEKTEKGRSKVPFADILEASSRKICQRAVRQIEEIYDPAIRFDYFVISGGTGAAWTDFIKEDPYFAGSDTVVIVRGNQGDPTLPDIFNNVRGYYIFGAAQKGN